LNDLISLSCIRSIYTFLQSADSIYIFKNIVCKMILYNICVEIYDPTASNTNTYAFLGLIGVAERII